MSGGPSVAGPFRCYWDQPIPCPFRPSSASPMMGIPAYRPPISYTHYGSPVSAKGVSLAYFGWDPHQGQWSFDLQRSERLTPPPPPVRTFARFPDSSSVSGLYFSLGPVYWPRVTTRFLFVEGGPHLHLGIG